MYLLIMLGKLVWGPLREPHGDGRGAGHASAHGAGGSAGHAHSGGGHASRGGSDHGVASAAHGSTLPTDLTGREIGILVPLALVCLAIGFYPKPMLESIAPSVEKTLARYPELVGEYAANGTLLPKDAADAVAVASDPTRPTITDAEDAAR
jgi:NADH-quinone oxidoreductase subunit M